MNKKHSIIITAAMALLAVLSGVAYAADKAGITLTADSVWVVAADQPECVTRALEDVKRDWYKVFGHLPAVVTAAPPARYKGPIVYLGYGGKNLAELVKEPFKGAESFVLRVQPDASGRPCIVATGADPRGSIYAAYALSEYILGIDPWYYWTDHEPARREGIAVAGDFDQSSGPPTFKYRGWFLNDEDLLSGFAPDPLRENPFSLEMLDRICETLLRARGNLIIPGTFIFPDERGQELASRRGLMLHMHHVTCVGLNTHRWPKNVPFSYNEHPEILEKYWRQCINAYKGREVVWTVGFRGQQDQPFWVYDKSLKSAQGIDFASMTKANGGFPFHLLTPAQKQEIGDVIAKAIAKQIELIQTAQPGAPMVINLYAEGAQLVREGYLNIPQGVTRVWSDDGTGVVRDKGGIAAGHGLYYHTAYLGYGQNHLTEMVNPGRIYSEIGAFVQAGATELLLNNGSNLRPVPLATDCVMRLAWDAKAYPGKSPQERMARFLEDWCRRQYGPAVAAEVAALYHEYFEIPYMQDRRRRGEHYLFNLVHELDREAYPLIRAGKPLNEKCLSRLGAKTDLKKYPAESLSYVRALSGKVQAMVDRIPAERRNFFLGHLVTQVKIHENTLAMIDAYGKGMDAYVEGDKAQAQRYMEEALKAMEGVFAALHAAEYGKWTDWYRGEGLVGLEPTRDMLRAEIAALEGNAGLISRHVWRTYGEISAYQNPFVKNFPLLYPPEMRFTIPSDSTAEPQASEGTGRKVNAAHETTKK